MQEGDGEYPLYSKDTSNGNKTTLGTVIQKICNDYKKQITKVNIYIIV